MDIFKIKNNWVLDFPGIYSSSFMCQLLGWKMKAEI